MNPVEEYILRQTRNNQEIMAFCHDILAHQLGFSAAIKWGLPYYTGNKGAVYLNRDKNGEGVHICFMRGKKLSNFDGLLQWHGRKLVVSYLATSLETIPESLIQHFEEALEVDKKSVKV